MLNLSARSHLLILCSAALLLFFPFLGHVHLFDWDEINFAECAREMIVSGDYSTVQIDYQPFWEKPPLFIWMQVLSMKLFGINEFAARFPNAVCGLITVLVVYYAGSRLFDRRFAFMWAMCFIGSLLPFLYFKSGIIDPWFNLFIFSGLWFAILHTNNPDAKTAAWSAFFLGLATLTKGPAALLIFGLCALVFWALKRFTFVTKFKYLFVFALVYLLTAGSWFLYEIASGNFKIVQDFFEYQVRLFKTEDAGHGGFFGYHFVVLFFGCFPASVFAIRAWRKSSLDTPFQKHAKRWMNILFWVVLILFSIVKTKIVHYSSLCYFPLTFLAAYSLHKLYLGEMRWKRWMTISLLFIAVVLSIAFIAVPLIDHYKDVIIAKTKDQFAKDCLNQNVGWMGFEWIAGVLFLVCSVWIILQLAKGKMHLSPILFTSVALILFFIMLFVTPRIEQYSQGPAITFYKSIPEEKYHVETVNFKSFAQLFYGNKKPENNTPELIRYVMERRGSDERTGQQVYSFQMYALNYMRTEAVDRPVYTVVKTDHAESFAKENPSFRRLYTEGGFVFFRREAVRK